MEFYIAVQTLSIFVKVEVYDRTKIRLENSLSLYIYNL